MQGLIIKKNFPGLIWVDGVQKVPQHWPDYSKVVLELDGGVTVTLAEKIKREFWVSLHPSALPILRIQQMSFK